MDDVDLNRIILSAISSKYCYHQEIDNLVNNESIFHQAVKTSIRNGLYFSFIKSLESINIEMPFLDEYRWKIELDRVEKFKNSLLLLNKASEDYGIEYILIKDCNTVPHAPRDVDIFIRDADRENVIRVFEKCGMKYVETSITEMVLKKKGYVDIEIYTRINYLNIDFLDEEYLFNSCAIKNIFEIEYQGLNNEANLLLTIIHDTLGHRRLTLLDFIHIINILDGADIKLCEQYAKERGWEGTFELALEKINQIYVELSENGKTIAFPYIFDKCFMMQCLSELDHEINRKIRFLYYISLLQDGIVERSKNSPIYDIIKSHKNVERLIAGIINASNFKKFRGDRH